MSTRRTDFGTRFEIYIGSTKKFNLVIEDPETGMPKVLSEDLYKGGQVVITTTEDIEIGNVPIVYESHSEGLIGFTITSEITTTKNAGNWTGKLQLTDNDSNIIDQQTFNFDIIDYK